MKYYYLLNGKIMSANEKMPVINEQWHTYNSNLLKWSESLKPCEISESELDRIKFYHRFNYNNPIEVTDIISDNNGVVIFKHKLPKASERVEEIMSNIKQVEEIEAVEFIEWCRLNKYVPSSEYTFRYEILPFREIKFISTHKLYEIFKNRKE